MQSRLPVSVLTCVELGEANGGIVVNISEGGLALTAAMKLPPIDVTPLRIQLPKSRQWITVNGQMQWKSESRKKAGFRFLDLSENDRKRIEEWIFQESASQVMESQTAAVLEEAGQSPAELPGLPSKSLMPGHSVPAEAGERQAGNSIPIADPIAAMPRIEKFIPKPLPPQRETVSNNHEHAEEFISISDQRLYEREPVRALAFMELGECNGGVILDISEGGVSVRAAVPLADDFLPHMRFQLPPDKQWIETSGRVVRLDESKTRAGIEFVDLSPAASMKISEWVASAASREESPGETTALYDKTAQLLETLTVRESEKAIPASPPRSMSISATPEKNDPIPSKVPAAPPRKTPVLVSATVPVILPPAPLPIRQPSRKASQESILRPVSAPQSPVAARPTWGTLTVSVALAALLSFAGAWIVAERAARDQVLRMLGTSPAAKAESANATQPSPPAANSNASAPPVEIPQSQPKSVLPAAVNTVAVVPAASPAPASPRKDIAALSAKSRITAAAVGKSTPPQVRAVESPAPKTVAIAHERSPEPPPAQALASQPVPANEKIAAVSNPISSQPASSPEAGANTKPTSTPAAPVPAPAEIAKGAVSVSYSPYPSIRIPAELKSQASHLGTSLQIGQVLSRVDPVYPEEAERQRIEGTVKLHVIIGTEGAVQSVQVLNGPASLAPAAMSALRQWRYKQTLFGGQPIEAEQDVTVAFRMTKLRP